MENTVRLLVFILPILRGWLIFVENCGKLAQSNRVHCAPFVPRKRPTQPPPIPTLSSNPHTPPARHNCNFSIL
jgi:hypothetical protein